MNILVPCLLLLAAPEPLHLDGPHFKDAAGGVVLLRGVNAAGNLKLPPFDGLRAEQLDPLPHWGVNVVRLIFTWEAYEPRAGVYDAAYLARYEALVRAAAKSMHVIIDFHQDALSRVLLDGCGEGFPAWAVSPRVPHASPDNGLQCAAWGMRMMVSNDLLTAWHDFYHGPARAAYLAMVTRVAQHFAGMPGVLGYDLINEPWGDEATDISAFLNDAAAAVRKVDPRAILFVSPHAMVDAGLQTDLPRPAFDNFVYAPHYYDGWVMGMSVWLGNNLTWPFGNMRAKAAEWNVPLFVAEYGAPASARRVGAYMDTLFERLDDGFISGAQWSYTPGWTATHKDGWNGEDLSIIDDKGALRPNFRPRAYPQRISGTPVTLSEGPCDLRWFNAPETGATVFYVPPHEQLVRVETEGDGVQCVAGAQVVRCASPHRGLMRVRLITGLAASVAVR